MHEIVYHPRALARASRAAGGQGHGGPLPVKGQRCMRFHGRPGTSSFNHFVGTTAHLQDRFAERRNDSPAFEELDRSASYCAASLKDRTARC